MSEYAPQYTFKERVKIIALHSLWAVPIFLIIDRLFFPWFGTTKWFICHPYGIEILWYGIFIGLPTVFGIMFSIFWWKNYYPVLKFKQYPPLNKKTFRKLKYRYGTWAVVISLFKLICVVSFFILTIWGYFTATAFLNEHNLKLSEQERQKECSLSAETLL